MGPSLRSQRERERIRAEYEARDADERVRARYSPDHPAVLLESTGLDAGIRGLLARRARPPHALERILEVGCGSGAQLRRMVRLGAEARNVWGVDLSRERLARAKASLPAARFIEADASELPFPDGVFDLVMQFTTLSSILDPDVRAAAAREMRRVLRPVGAILSYDFRVGSPRSATRPIDRAELERLFPGMAADVRSVTLAPPLARALAGRAGPLARLLARVPALRTHHLALLGP